jgi:TPR repeat protein
MFLKPYVKLMGMTVSRNVGVAEAWNALGDSYRDGRGYERDAKKAFENYITAARYGSCQAQLNVGMCFLKGTGIKQDFYWSRTWLRKAADCADLAEPQFNLAELLFHGLGKEEMNEEQEAYEYYKRAAQHGWPGALEKMQNLMLSGAIKTSSDMESFDSTMASDEQKNPDVLYSKRVG